MGAPAVRRLGPPAVRKIDASAVRRLGARAVRKLSECSCCEKAGLVIARDGVSGRSLNDEIVVIINYDKFIFISVCC